MVDRNLIGNVPTKGSWNTNVHVVNPLIVSDVKSFSGIIYKHHFGDEVLYVVNFIQIPCGVLIDTGVQPQGIIIVDKRKVQMD